MTYAPIAVGVNPFSCDAYQHFDMLNARLGGPRFGLNSPLCGTELQSNGRGMLWVGVEGGEGGRRFWTCDYLTISE